MPKSHRRWAPGLGLVLGIIAFWGAAQAQSKKPDVEYVPTPHHVVAEMLRLAETKREDVVYDLGCGDGRVVIMAAKEYGTRGVGVDIDPQRIEESRENARQAGVVDRARFLQQNLFETDFREATLVTLYLLPQLNRQLRPRLLSELRPGTRIVSHDFDMGEWYPDKVIRVPGSTYEHTVYYWVVPAKVDGVWRVNMPTPAGERQYRLHLQQQFQEVSGTISARDEELPIANATLAGDHLRYTVTTTGQSPPVKMSFDGRIADDIVHGSVEVQGGPTAGRHEWTATREGGSAIKPPQR
jgi:SAM-dependent methyltransferase